MCNYRQLLRFQNRRPDFLQNATAPLQSAAAATTDIPILGTSVTDYATALDISDWSGTTGRNISGTSDLAPLSEQAAMLNELFRMLKMSDCLLLRRSKLTVSD